MRLKHRIITKMMNDENITFRSAIIILINLVKRQNKMGYANNIHYKEICEDADYTRESFYTALKQLRDNGYIQIVHIKRNGFYDVKIIDNTFDKLKEQYLNLNDKELLDKNLKSLSTSELKIYLYGRMTIYTTENRKNPYSQVSVMRIAQIIGVKSHYLIKKMIENIKRYTKMVVNLERESNKPNWLAEILYLACPKSSEKAFVYDDFAMYYYDIKSRCNRAGIDSGIDEQSIHDAVTLINQYHKRIDPNQIYKFILNTIMKRRAVEPKYLNMMLRTEFSI